MEAECNEEEVQSFRKTDYKPKIIILYYTMYFTILCTLLLVWQTCSLSYIRSTFFQYFDQDII